jgi:hypothetical protein
VLKKKHAQKNNNNEKQQQSILVVIGPLEGVILDPWQVSIRTNDFSERQLPQIKQLI